MKRSRNILSTKHLRYFYQRISDENDILLLLISKVLKYIIWAVICKYDTLLLFDKELLVIAAKFIAN